MIDITYKSIRPPPVKTDWRNTWKPPEKKEPVLSLAPPVNDEQGSLWAEAQRRDAIIKELASQCKFVEGEVCTPYNKEMREKHGDRIVIEKICDNYAAFRTKQKKDDWPESDQPLIILARDLKSTTRFFCSVNFLIPLNTDGSTPETE